MPAYDNEPAFPTTDAHGTNYGCPGLTKREYFAGKIVTAYLTKAGMPSDTRERDLVANKAVMMADSLLQALK